MQTVCGCTILHIYCDGKLFSSRQGKDESGWVNLVEQMLRIGIAEMDINL